MFNQVEKESHESHVGISFDLDGAVKLNDLNVEDITTDDSRVDD
jgi:hypothetical protein